MSWIELSLNTTHEAVDWVRTLLAEANYTEAIAITPYTKPDPNNSSAAATSPNWAFTIHLHLPHDFQARSRVDRIAQLLLPLQRTGLTTELSAVVIDEKPALAQPLVHQIGQRFVVLSPEATHTAHSSNEVPLRLKTSLAFGSGLHPATILSLRLIEQHVTPAMNALDLGSGSGILSVAMAKLGAQVVAVDNDRIAVEATQDAVCRNEVEQQVTVVEGSLGQGSNLGHWMGGTLTQDVSAIEATAAFDLIMANILARVHVDLVPDYRSALRQTHATGGLLLTAGFTTDQEETVNTALTEAGFKAVNCERLNEWVAFAHQLQS